MTVNIEFIKVYLPPIDKQIAFHDANFLLIFFNLLIYIITYKIKYLSFFPDESHLFNHLVNTFKMILILHFLDLNLLFIYNK